MRRCMQISKLNVNYLFNGLMDLKKLTSNVKQIQDYVWKEILTLNANTEYLRGYLHGSCDKELFKKNVPVVSYDDVKPYIERVVNGEPSNVISGKPITRFLLRYVLPSMYKICPCWWYIYVNSNVICLWHCWYM